MGKLPYFEDFQHHFVVTLPLGTCLMNGSRFKRYPPNVGLWLTFPGIQPTVESIQESHAFSKTYSKGSPIRVYRVHRRPRLLNVPYVSLMLCDDDEDVTRGGQILEFLQTLDTSSELDAKDWESLRIFLVDWTESNRLSKTTNNDFIANDAVCKLGFDGFVRTSCMQTGSDEVFLCPGTWQKFVRLLDPKDPADLRLMCTEEFDVVARLNESMQSLTRKRTSRARTTKRAKKSTCRRRPYKKRR